MTQVRAFASEGVRLVGPFGRVVTFDVSTQEDYSDTREITRHPVEAGAAISDHIIKQPLEVTIGGMFTDTPVGPALPIPGRALASYERLLELQDQGLPVVLISNLRGAIQNLGISGVTLSRTPADGQALRVAVTLQEIRTAFTLEVPIPPDLIAPPIKDPATGTADAGTQAPVSVPLDAAPTEATGIAAPPEAAVAKSRLARLVDGEGTSSLLQAGALGI
jgi:hypothetical protein